MSNKPNKTKADVIHSISKAIAGAATLGIGSEVINFIIGPPIQRRRDEWIESIEQDLKILQEKFNDFDINNLSENEVFIDTLLTATNIAIRNHQEEKRKYLRNCILNTIFENSVEISLFQTYLNFIEQFSPLHIKLLNLFNEGFCWIRSKRSRGREDFDAVQISSAVVYQYEQLKPDRELIEFIISDLQTKELIQSLEVNNIEKKDTTNLYRISAVNLYGEIAPLNAKHKGNFGTVNTTGYITVSTKIGTGLLNFIKSPITGELPGESIIS